MTPRTTLEQAGLSVEITHGDICDLDSIERAMNGIDAVVHAAGLISLRSRDKSELLRVNVAGTKHVLDVARARHLRVLHTSSIATFGTSPWPEMRNERTVVRGGPSPYAYEESKRQAEEVALASARKGGDVVVLCPGIMLGPGDLRFSSTRFVRHYLRGELRLYLGGGISFCDVRDVAAAYVAALTEGRSGERYLVAGVNRTYRESLEELWELTGLYRPFSWPFPLAQSFALWSDAASRWFPHPFEELNLAVVNYAQSFNFCDSRKAARELGYRVGDFRAMLKDTVADHLARGVRRSITPALARAVQAWR